MIELVRVTRKYGQKVAVSELDLHVAAGEVFAFLGPNGAGKTTTIKMMVGLLRPTSGQLLLSDIDVVKQSRRAKAILGYVPDQPQLYDKLSGREFLQFIADMYGMPASHASAAIDEQIAAFELQEFVDQLTESYSHGMKQRLVFASALVHRPAVLVVDEPMVGLDPRSIRLVKDLLRSRADAGTTVFMSTHTLSVAEEMADRIAVVDQGHLLFLGTVDDLRRRLSLHDSSLEHLYLQLTAAGNGHMVPGRTVGARPVAEL
jgi:ABC-2 type transport system ATP-binding protein